MSFTPRPVKSYARLTYDWMGCYPRKGADWSPDEDRALVRAYESGRYLTKEIAARHLREPVAIERRIDLLRKRAKPGAICPERNWQTERETAQRAITEIKGLFSDVMWARPKGKSILPIRLRALAPGDLLMHKGEMCVVQAVTIQQDATHVAVVALTDLPPEVAQALQFGGES
jgi:hypothetical protein